MDRLLVFSGLALELVVACWPFPVLLLGVIVNPLAQGKVFLVLAEASLALAPASLGFTVAGLLRKRTMALAYRELLIGLSLLAIVGTLVSSFLIFGIFLAYSTGCDPLTLWKCYFDQGATYLGYYFFPAIAVPILTLVWVSRTRLPTSSL